MSAEEEFERMSKYKSLENNNTRSVLEKIRRKIENHKHIILYGPPGTGKTRLISTLLENQDANIYHTEFVQFHPQYSYQDFIEGYSVKAGVFDYKPGIFLNFVDTINQSNSNNHNLLFIDEINRADISSVFGELLTLLDDPSNKEIKLSASNRILKIDSSFSIVGTMNSADKNIAIMDFALRRRFDFIFVAPDYMGMTAWLHSYGFGFEQFNIEQYVEFAAEINRRITAHPILGKNMTLGQALFVPSMPNQKPIQLIDICEMIADKVIPQIEAYLGIGNFSDLATILSPDIRHKVEQGAEISDEDIVSFVRSVIPAKDE